MNNVHRIRNASGIRGKVYMEVISKKMTKLLYGFLSKPLQRVGIILPYSNGRSGTGVPDNII